MTINREHIIQRAYDVFRADLATTPSITLRGGSALSFYDEPPPYDPDVDAPTDAYIEQCAFEGVGFLDAPSWRHYLPRLIEYSLRNIASHQAGTMAIEGFLSSRRPPDRDPPRLGSLNKEQEAVIVAALDELAFTDESVYREFAQQVMEEWWIPNALYRPESRPE